MTVQQVNLYSDEFRPKKDPLSVTNMLVALAVLWLLGAGYAAWLYWDVHQSQAQLAHFTGQNRALQTQIESYQAQLAARAKDQYLETEQSRLRLSLSNTQGLLDAIAKGMNEEGNRIAFASIMVALAKHQLEPLWLEQIKILTGGERVVLTGSTTKPEAVPLYLEALGRETAFSGRAFNEFVLQLPEDGVEDLRHFTVDTQAETDIETEVKTDPALLSDKVSWARQG